MNQRSAVRGRPSGTDGSDFSYRMVVDSTYTKVAKAKSRLAKLIIVQFIARGLPSVVYLYELLHWSGVYLVQERVESPDRVSVVSLVIGFVSVVAGELGRKKSRSNFLKFYVFGSSMAILLSVAYLAMSNLQSEVWLCGYSFRG
ncbi:hypothetical protein KY290_007080 [Solanum tuberosum]|uniref:Uncharacterized protein n=1 Tax=Solanum tuberosum TaxID=4113 RepID=A0ABQ7W4J3_SOLTU|nr:hypothetical protein KY290_007080 [Solanum tuberosum]